LGSESVELTLRSHTLLQLEVAYNMIRISVIGFPYPRKVYDRNIHLSDPQHHVEPSKSQNSRYFKGTGADNKNVSGFRQLSLLDH